MRDLSTKSSGESGYRVDAAGRMERVRTLFASAAALGLGLIAFATAAAQPQLPATYYGTVTISGEPAAAGIEVRGFVNGAGLLSDSFRRWSEFAHDGSAAKRAIDSACRN